MRLPQASASAQAQPASKPSLEVYSFAILDIGHDLEQIDPNWCPRIDGLQGAR